MIRDKIIERLKMTEKEKIIEKILNNKTLTKDESEIIYSKKEIETMNYQFEISNVKLTEEEQKNYNEIIFKEEIKNDTLIKELKESKENQILEIVTKLGNNFTNSENILSSQKNSENNDLLNNLNKYFQGYIDHKKNFNKVSKSSISSYNSTFNYLKYFIDKDTILNFSFFKNLQQKLQQLPKNFFKYKKYYEKTFEEVLKLKEIDNYDTLNNKTINNHIINLKQFFNYLQYEEIIKENPLSNIKLLIENKETRKVEYTEKELKMIFNSNIEETYLNMCKIALYTGFRIEELLSIKKENIKDNSIHIELKDTNNKKHKRILPIHKNINKIIDYQKRNNDGEYLFFSGEKEVGNVGKRVNRRIRSVIPNRNKSFHSFRKNFAQEIELNTNTEEKIKKYLIGHTLEKDITHSIYNRGKININKLIDSINQITFNY